MRVAITSIFKCVHPCINRLLVLWQPYISLVLYSFSAPISFQLPGLTQPDSHSNSVNDFDSTWSICCYYCVIILSLLCIIVLLSEWVSTVEFVAYYATAQTLRPLYGSVGFHDYWHGEYTNENHCRRGDFWTLWSSDFIYCIPLMPVSSIYECLRKHGMQMSTTLYWRCQVGLLF